MYVHRPKPPIATPCGRLDRLGDREARSLEDTVIASQVDSLNNLLSVWCSSFRTYGAQQASIEMRAHCVNVPDMREYVSWLQMVM